MRNCSCHSHNGFQLEGGEAELAEQTSLEGLTPMSEADRVDKVGSVSALVEGEGSIRHCWPEDEVLEEQHRRFHNGS